LEITTNFYNYTYFPTTLYIADIKTHSWLFSWEISHCSHLLYEFGKFPLFDYNSFSWELPNQQRKSVSQVRFCL